MLDFLTIATRKGKKDIIEVYPKFIIRNPSKDLMIRGGDFYAVWIEEAGVWSTSEQDVIDLVEKALAEYIDENHCEGHRCLHMWDSETGIIDAWHKYCQKQMRDSYHPLDEKLIFSNDPVQKKDYASKRLSYPLEPGKTPAWDKLIGTLYSEEERHKIEWSIGAIVTGDSKELQKFIVLYGEGGTGKSTILNVIQQLFEGYWAVFDAKALGSNSNSFALEAFKGNPLVAIQHDGDLSRIEDNSVINSLVSHEKMTVNEKFKSTYATNFNAFLYLGTNRPVKITDAKSGLIRRMIDVKPSGKKLNRKEYNECKKQISFELGAIASHCKEVYLENPGYYDDYIPVRMMGASNDFYNFIVDNFHIFKRDDSTTLNAAWEMYKVYCDEANVPFKASKMKFKEELKNYFWDYSDKFELEDGSRARCYYSRFRLDRFETEKEKPKNSRVENSWISFKDGPSLFDEECSDCLAQYASDSEVPMNKWEKVKTRLSTIDTSQLHYVKVPENHIVIDFDLKNEKGEKDLALNVSAASSWPSTYCELSKSGSALHLHYIYTGDVRKLSYVYSEGIEVKVFTGGSSLRRKLTKCNDIPIATISSGLPLRKENAKVINKDVVQTEKGLRTTIKKCLMKEVHANTKSNIDFIYDILNKAYESGLKYDVSDMKNAVVTFGANSTNQASLCLQIVEKMKFKSDEPSLNTEDDEAELVFFDCEVFPNLFLVNWKVAGEGKPVVRMINPTPQEIENLLQFRLVGFNCRRYDNHMLYARLIGYSEEEIYKLSQRIINSKKGEKGVLFGEAYNLSYTDVYDFAAEKQSLKKWEIELGIHHQELGLPWDQPVPEEKWIEVAEYCDNDVIATEAVFNHLKGDFTARQILADVAGLTVNDTTNTLTTKIIFGGNKKPQSQFNYRNMGEKDPNDTSNVIVGLDCDWDYTIFDKKGRPIFPGYKYEFGKSTYRGEEVGEGGYVYAEPGMYGNIALLDIASMHPSSIIAEELFGPEYTKRFEEIKEARVAIKHKDFDKARTMLNGSLAKYLDDESTAADLAQALKIAINSVYGLTAASFDHPFHDPRNKDNIVAKRGALFMVNLKHEVQNKGYTVAHIKTDSIKIPDASPEIIQFVMDYGKLYGYIFEHEATYDRMCLVNNAVYIAKYKDGKHAGEWTATGAQFQIPYVYKSLFSKEEITFEDMCETKSVTSALYLDMNENLEDVSKLEKELFVIRKGDREHERQVELEKIIAENHDYHFIGKVGLFCPIKPGCGGGELVREGKDKEGRLKYDSATGANGYRWLEAETVKTLGKEKDIDRDYYENLVAAAREEIGKYGDFHWFVSDDPYISDGPPWFSSEPPWEEESTPFDVR